MKIFTKDPTTNLISWLRFLGAMLTVTLMISVDALAQSSPPAKSTVTSDASTVSGPTLINSVEDGLVPQEFALIQNYPNPFNPTTTIRYGITEKSNVKIILLNVIGEEVAVVLNEEKESGYHQVEFNAAILLSGVYFCQLQAGDFVGTRKMVLLK